MVPAVNSHPAFPANPKRDFRTPRKSLGERLSGFAKPLAVILIASAMPAFTANGALDMFAANQARPVESVTPMPFETAGESFPGSAFYYLEDAPRQVATAANGTVEVIGEATLAASALAEIPLAARPLRIAGSDRDHLRAQQCMTQAIYYEAASESDAGQRAVAQVVMNRVAHSAYPRTVCGVVYQGSERATGCQFTFTCDGSLARRPAESAWNRASRIAREALAGVVYAPVGTATHYHTLAVNPYWASSLESVGVIGAHIFYRWRGAAGRPQAFTASYSGDEPAPARARALTPVAPDPASAPTMAAAPSAGEPTAGLPRENAPAAARSQAANEVLPGSGTVRSEYANSGRWIVQP